MGYVFPVRDTEMTKVTWDTLKIFFFFPSPTWNRAMGTQVSTSVYNFFWRYIPWCLEDLGGTGKAFLCACVLLGGSHLEYLSVLHILLLPFHILFPSCFMLWEALLWAASAGLFSFVSGWLWPMGQQQEEVGSSRPPALFVLRDLFCVLWVGHSFCSVALSARQLQLQIFLGSGNPGLMPLHLEMIMASWYFWPGSIPPSLAAYLNPTYTFEDCSFIKFSWISYLNVLFFAWALLVMLTFYPKQIWGSFPFCPLHQLQLPIIAGGNRSSWALTLTFLEGRGIMVSSACSKCGITIMPNQSQ